MLSKLKQRTTVQQITLSAGNPAGDKFLAPFAAVNQTQSAFFFRTAMLLHAACGFVDVRERFSAFVVCRFQCNKFTAIHLHMSLSKKNLNFLFIRNISSQN